MYERLKGLVVIKHKKDCLDLPDKQYRKIYCKPNKSTLRVARALVDTAETTSKGAALLRELSDGFQYRMEHDGTMVPCSHCEGSGEIDEWFDDTDRSYKAIDMLDPKLVEKLEKRRTKCPDCKGKKELKHMVRITKEVPSPKETALRELLEENEEQGRIVIFAGFTGSVDRCVRLCLKNQWDVFRCDGRGMVILRQESDGEVTQLPDEDCLEYWANRDNTRVAFVAHPESGGMGLTLTEASMAVFYSNSYKPEYRVQAEDRIHRPGMDHNRGATIVDLLHLPTDERALQIIRENRRIELMTMGEIADCLSDDAAGEGFEVAA
jgi:SNF2 family DNA or RNA helicase